MEKTVKKKSNRHMVVNSSLILKPMKQWAWLFMGPTVLAFAIGFIYPFIRGFMLSFTKFRTTSDAKFLGFGNMFGNYISAFKDPSFLHAFWYTALFTIVSVVLINVLDRGTA